MDNLELQDIHVVGLAASRRRYRAAIARALGALAELPEIADAIRHSAGALSAEAQALSEKFLADQDGHLFAAAYD